MDTPFAQAYNSMVGSGDSEGSPFGDAYKQVTGSEIPDAPQDLKAANQEQGSQDYNHYCETFAEQMTGSPNMGATAAEAWQNWNQAGKASPDWQSAPAGSLVYFAPDQSNQDAGHVAIADGKGNIIGATDNGVETHPLEDWIKMTGQTPLGYVRTQ